MDAALPGIGPWDEIIRSPALCIFPFRVAQLRDARARGGKFAKAIAAGIATKVGNHSFRAIGITAYLKNGGTLEKAASMANHASTRTTQLYDRRRDEMCLDEAERVVI
jgi:integrase